MILYFKHNYFDILNYWGGKGTTVLTGNKPGTYSIGSVKLMLKTLFQVHSTCICNLPGTDRDKGGTEEEGADPAAVESTGDISGGGEESLPHQHSRRREGPQDGSQVFLINHEELLFTQSY